jgi:hypothetical protein
VCPVQRAARRERRSSAILRCRERRGIAANYDGSALPKHIPGAEPAGREVQAQDVMHPRRCTRRHSLHLW